MTAPPSLSHGRAFELIPWLVNGTLAESERGAVEAHVRSCIACRRELKAQQRLLGAIRARPTADVPAEAGFERLAGQLDAAGSRSGWRLDSRAAAPFAIAAAAGLAVLAILVWFTPLPEPANNTYSTLATPATGEAALLDVVFAENTTAAEISALLDDIGGEIVAGPSDLGRYQVRVADAGADPASLAAVVGMLSRDERVRFAGRSLTEPPQ